MKRKIQFGLNTGITFLFVLFVLICLIIFSALSLVSANADYNLSTKYSNHTSDYYEACNKAVSTETIIDDTLISCYDSATSIEDYYNILNKKLDDISDSIVLQEKNIFISYQIEINETQNLLVILNCPYPLKQGDTYYSIDTWQVSSNQDWNPDTHLNVLP